MRRRERRKLHKFYLNQQRRAENALNTDELVFGPKVNYYRTWVILSQAIARRIDLQGQYGSSGFYEMAERYRQKAAAYETRTERNFNELARILPQPARPDRGQE
jgi:hypothetical protein